MKNLHQIWLKNFLKSWKKLWMTMKIDNKKKMGLFLLGDKREKKILEKYFFIIHKAFRLRKHVRNKIFSS